MTKNDLFIGCLGNGITVCDKSREEHGDYKHIAHIRESGVIKWYIDKSTLPAEVLGAILRHADRQHLTFLTRFNSMSPINRYAYLADHATLSDFLTALKEPTIERKIAYLFKRQLERDTE